MLLICEGIFFLLGLYIIFTGKFRVSRNRLVTGTRARVAGLLLLLPGPVALLMGLLIGLSLNGDMTRLSDMTLTITSIEILLVVGCLIAAIVIGITAPVSEVIPAAAQSLPDILTLSEAAQYVRVSEADLRQMIETGKLKAVAIGGDYRLSKESLNAIFRQ